MWLVNLYNNICLRNNKLKTKTSIYYNAVFYIFLRSSFFRKKKNFFFTSKHLLQKNLFFATLEHSNARFRYLGKAYRISKKGKLLLLTMHYPTRHVLVWKNIKLKYSKKKKRLFKFKFLTNAPIKINLFLHLFKLRIPNTYTKRGIPNNVYPFYYRKRKIASHR